TGVFLASMDGGQPKRLAPANSTAFPLPQGMIIFARDGSLWAQHLDLEHQVVTGDAIRISDLIPTAIMGFAGLSTSSNGVIAYRSAESTQRQLKWYDRTGKALGAATEPDSASILYPELSPDGKQVAIMRNAGNPDVWLADLSRGSLSRMTFDPGV